MYICVVCICHLIQHLDSFGHVRSDLTSGCLYLCNTCFIRCGHLLILHLCIFTVAHPQDPHHTPGKLVIQCYKCGEPCKGEVLRVQSKHFHIKCFTCKGKIFKLGYSTVCYFFLRSWMKNLLNREPDSQARPELWGMKFNLVVTSSLSELWPQDRGTKTALIKQEWGI